MSIGVSLIKSGLSLIDRKWGGIYRGGSYMIIGPRKSGRTILGLQFAEEAVKDKETVLYFTTMRPKDLMFQASSVNFDLQTYMNKNRVIVVRVASPDEAYDHSVPDDYLIEYINDIITIVDQYNPSRIIFDELTTYVGFRSISLLKDVFLHTLEVIEERDITSVYVIGEPATQKAMDIVDTLAESVTGTIRIKKSSGKIRNEYHGGSITISPNVGHAEGQFSEEFYIKPYSGIIISAFEDEEEAVEIERPEPISDRATRAPGGIPFEPVNKASTDDMLFSNVYELNDFSLVLNNQIALFRSTGQTFNLVSLKLDPAAQIKGLLSLNQLQNSVRVSVDKKDKICVQENKILILLTKSTDKSVNKLLAKFVNNLPSSDESYIEAIRKFIAVMNVEVNENIVNADTMLNYVNSADDQGNDMYTSMSKLG